MKLYDGGKIIAGILIFLILITIPFWYGRIKATALPEPSLATETIDRLEERKCLEDRQYMRNNHAKLLTELKNQVVREGNRIYVAKDGRKHTISLSSGCLGCHSNKSKFCDRCHDGVGAKPNCFSCHHQPKEVR